MQTGKIKDQLKMEGRKIRKLKGKAKWSYIWDYYKILIIFIAFLVFFVGYIINMLHSAIADHYLYVTFVNTTKDVGTHSELWDEYVDYTRADTGKTLVEFNANSYFDYLENGASGNKYYEVFVTYIDAGTLDAAVMERSQLEAFGATGRFLDLDSDQCREIKEKYEDRFIYVTPNDETLGKTKIPVGIDISDSTLISEYQIYPDGTDCALGIGAYSQNQGAVLEFLDMIFGEDTDSETN